MKFTIELDEFWMDEDSGYLEDELKKSITTEIVTTIKKSIETKIDDEIKRKVSDVVEKTMYKQANLYIKKYLSTGTIKSRVHEGGNYVEKDITIEEYICNKFKNDSGWSSPNDRIEKLAKVIGEDMKKRYDLLFASQIVSKLSENGLLKEDIAKMLMDSNKK